MKALWLFVGLIVFCIYVLFGLYLTEGIDSLVQIILTWVIYTILWTTFINVFILAYFWSVVRNKTGPVGLRGPSGERGKVGIQGQCSISAGQAYCMKALNDYIDALYKSKTNKSILNEDLQTFPNNYLNNKISTMAGSRQYQVILANLSNDNKPVINIINYLKSIWSKWFDLLYNSTNVPGEWFTDEYADEEYTWVGDTNPFNEIKKYDIYYWGITRNFRPLKAEICRTSSLYTNPKIPIPNRPLEPRLKIIKTDNYRWMGDDKGSGVEGNVASFRPLPIDIGNDSYYPLGDIIIGSNYKPYVYYLGQYNGLITTGDFQYNDMRKAHSDLKSLLVAGDVKTPISYTRTIGYGGSWNLNFNTPVCPDGYTDLGDVTSSRIDGNPSNSNSKCVPTECVEEVPNQNRKYVWTDSGNNYTLNNRFSTNTFDATDTNGYNLFRGNSGKTFYKIKDSCLSLPDNKGLYTKDVEEQNGDLGIGWYGHPYKLEPQYSIFTFLNLVPEGMIVHKGTGRRFYIIHYGGEESNLYNILDYNDKSDKYDKSLQADSNTNNSAVRSRNLSRTDERQQWIIVLQSDSRDNTKLNKMKLKNLFNGKSLYLGLDPIQGTSQFSTVNIVNYTQHPAFSNLTQSQIEDGTSFTFISTFGANLNIINNDNLVK